VSLLLVKIWGLLKRRLAVHTKIVTNSLPFQFFLLYF
jgi:hypothetical protein